MKYILTIFLTTLLLFSCVHQRKTSDFKQFNIPKDLQEFLVKFESATLSHNKAELLTLMDEDYRKEQHDEMLKGRTDQFLDELFCGYVSEKTFKCPGFEKVSYLKLTKIENNTDSYTVYYSVKAGKLSFSADWQITVTKTLSGTKYGIYGAVG